MYYSSEGKGAEVGKGGTQTSCCNIDFGICDVCYFKLQLLWAVLRLIPVRVKKQPLTSGELPATQKIIHF